jgi:single-strand DNA-binding protein
MASVNKIIIVGNLGADPEMRYLPSGDPVANMRVATTEKWKDKQGNQQEHTEWHRCNMFGRLAEIVGQYLKKGSSVYLEGRVRTRKWTDQAGVEKFSTEINVDQIQMLDGKRGDTGAAPATQKPLARPAADKPAAGYGGDGGFDGMADDVPF